MDVVGQFHFIDFFVIARGKSQFVRSVNSGCHVIIKCRS